MGEPETDAGRQELRADCSRCFGLCCVASALTWSADFAIDKPAGVPCLHLADDHRCSIHDRLIPSGFPGCVAFDCFGAGQRVAQETFGGRDWRLHPDVVEPMMAAFPVVRDLHELLWYLQEALSMPGGDAATLQAAVAEAEREAGRAPAELAETDVGALQARVAPLLRAASAAVREGLGGPDEAEADLAGADLRGRDLTGGCFRGAVLIGADLRDADLSYADLLGADLRGADVRGSRLGSALFLTRRQLGAARGDATTTLPATVEHPAHWE